MSLEILLLFAINLSDGTVCCVLLTSACHAHFHPLPICRRCILLQEGWGNMVAKGQRQCMPYLFPRKKNSLLKKYPCSGAEAVPLMSSLVLARRPLRPLLSIMTRHCDQSPQNKSCSSKANISERFSYSCFTEHEMELKGNIKWVIKLKTWCLVISS